MSTPTPAAPIGPGSKAATTATPPTPVTYDVEHVTTYRYSMPVTVSHQCAHLRPRSFGTQQVLSTHLRASPLPQVRSERLDYFGNTVTSFSLSEPHDSLTVISECRVKILPPPPPNPAASPPWEEVAARLRQGFGADTLDACQMLFDSTHVTTTEEIRDYAAASFPEGRPILDGALELTSRINRDFTYDPTATTIATPLKDVLANRRGVCQDFAHLQIACLRSLGLAARYVSGYVLTQVEESGERLEGGDASHAWISVFVPCPASPNGGWVDLDPTNNKMITREHVTVAWGRDFDDVSPIKGVMLGGGAQDIEVAVTLRPASRGITQLEPPLTTPQGFPEPDVQRGRATGMTP